MTEVDHILRNVDKGKHYFVNTIKDWTIHNHVSLTKYINTERSGHIWPNFRPHLHTIHVDDDYDGEYIVLDISVAV